MISAIVLVTGEDRPPQRVQEVVARSLGWLVSAVVAGVVRDVAFACPPSWPIANIIEHAGCSLARDEREAVRLAVAARLVKAPRVLAITAGLQPEGPLTDEIDAAERRLAPAGRALLLRAPTTFMQRLFPDSAPAVGLLLPRDRLLAAPTDLAALVRETRADRLRTRLVPVV